MELWNGLTPRRTDLSTVKATSHEDYLVLQSKIRELQVYLMNLTGNIQIMPNLELALQEVQDRIQTINQHINDVSLPQEVVDRLDELEQLIREVDRRPDTLQLRRDFESLKERVVRNQIEVLQLQSSFATEVKGFQNKIWGQFERFQNETASKIATLEEQVRHIDAQVDLQASLNKFQQLKTK